jgi:hypothetical protein
MNPGAVEEGAAVAKGVVEGLRSQPLSLALIVVNVVFVFFVGFVFHTINARTIHQYEFKDDLISKLIDKCHLGQQDKTDLENGGHGVLAGK